MMRFLLGVMLAMVLLWMALLSLQPPIVTMFL
jgi:hypothetical protein